jgi:hypothetical protein
LTQVCDLMSGSDEVVVNDDGAQEYGSQACQTFTGQGWSAPSSSSPSTTNDTGGCNCSVSDLPNRCDANIATTSGLSCALAENTFYEFFKTTEGQPSDPSQQATVQAWDPGAKQYDSENCAAGEGVVDCSAATGDSDIRFNQTAVAKYTDAQAGSYATGGQLGPHG